MSVSQSRYSTVDGTPFGQEQWPASPPPQTSSATSVGSYGQTGFSHHFQAYQSPYSQQSDASLLHDTRPSHLFTPSVPDQIIPTIEPTPGPLALDPQLETPESIANAVEQQRETSSRRQTRRKPATSLSKKDKAKLLRLCIEHKNGAFVFGKKKEWWSKIGVMFDRYRGEEMTNHERIVAGIVDRRRKDLDEMGTGDEDDCSNLATATDEWIAFLDEHSAEEERKKLSAANKARVAKEAEDKRAAWTKTMAGRTGQSLAVDTISLSDDAALEDSDEETDMTMSSRTSATPSTASRRRRNNTRGPTPAKRRRLKQDEQDDQITLLTSNVNRLIEVQTQQASSYRQEPSSPPESQNWSARIEALESRAEEDRAARLRAAKVQDDTNQKVAALFNMFMSAKKR